MRRSLVASSHRHLAAAVARAFAAVAAALSSVGAASAAERFDPRAEFLREVVRAVPTILESQDPATGRFGPPEGWTVARQDVLLILAAAWAAGPDGNPHSRDGRVLTAIIAGGDALIAAQDDGGRFPFRGSDGAEYGRTYLPWTCSRWVRAYAVVKNAMPADAKARWERALDLGFTGIAAELGTSPVQNIPAHHAMALYVAGRALDRPEWRRKAAEFLVAVADAQDESGFWSEHVGPVVNYGFVYVDALGTYHALSRDDRVLPALERASRFYANFTYPDGSYVETVDERNPYDLNWFKLPNVGFSFSPEVRGFVRRQLARKRDGGQPIDPDVAASFILYGEAGEVAAPVADREEAVFVLGRGDALVRRDAPWFICLSAYHAPVVPNRWIQDRQNFVSLYHDKAGLILGGGNTKLQPLWSTFTVGDPSLLSHRPGDEAPDFLPPPGLNHVPSGAELEPGTTSLTLTYGEARCRIAVDMRDPDSATLTYSLERPVARRVEAHLPLMPRIGAAWETDSGRRGTLGDEPLRLAAGEAGSWFAHDGWRLSLPAGASVTWPVLPHQPYARDGRAATGEGRIVVTLPLGDGVLSRQVRIAVP